MSTTLVEVEQDSFPHRLVLATAICLLSLPLAALSGWMGLTAFGADDPGERMVMTVIAALWPLACVAGPAAAWTGYAMGARRIPWLFVVWPLMFDIVGVAAFISAALRA